MSKEGSKGGAREGGRGQGRERNFKGCTLRRTLASIHYATHKTTHNVALALETLLLQIENGERVYRPKLCSVMRRKVLFDRWMT